MQQWFYCYLLLSINKLIQSKVYYFVKNWERTNLGDNINA